jgi:hypothetical protein
MTDPIRGRIADMSRESLTVPVKCLQQVEPATLRCRQFVQAPQCRPQNRKPLRVGKIRLCPQSPDNVFRY